VTRRSIWIGIGIFLLAMLATIEPSGRKIALSDISLGGSSAQAKQHKWSHWHHHHRPYTPPILDTLEDLELDTDDDGPDDDDSGPDDEDNGPNDDSDDD
jgi:hypothetical protein